VVLEACPVGNAGFLLAEAAEFQWSA
jgi:hypothetical protein